MKQTALFFALSGTLLFASCNDNNDNNYHYLDIPGSSVIFADQERDTVNIISTDSWTASEDADWMELAYTSYDAKGQSTSRMVPITVQPNLTGKARGAYVRVRSNGRNLNKSKVQVYWMNIVRPLPVYTDDSHHSGSWILGDNLDDLSVTFAMTDSAYKERDSIRFYLYDTAATLSTTADWVTILNNQFTRPDRDLVRLKTAVFTMTPNTTGTDRTAIFTLRSANGVSTQITLTQLKD